MTLCKTQIDNWIVHVLFVMKMIEDKDEDENEDDDTDAESDDSRSGIKSTIYLLD